MPLLIGPYVNMGCKFFRRDSKALPWNPPVHLTSVGYEKWYRDFPATVYRSKPLDLWLFSTARTTTRTVYDDSGCDMIKKDGLEMYINNKCRFSAAISSVSYPTEPVFPLDPIYNKIRQSLRRDATNLAQQLAEYRQTAQLFGDLAQVVASRGKSLAKSFRKDPASTVARKHLAYQYGVRPLCSDIIGSIEDLKRGLKPTYLSGKVSRSAYVERTGTVPADSLWHSTPWVVTKSINSYLVVHWRSRLSPQNVLTTLAAHGFTNPIAIGYELVPYSFVIDWWINIGGVLASLDNLLLAEDLKVKQTTSKVYSITQTGGYGGRYFESTRTDIRGTPGEISRVESLTYKPSASLQHIVNGIALLQLARKRF